MSTVPDVEGIIRLPGLDAPVEILRDGLGIPHLRARTTHDAFFGQGFVHAQDRLWQMEYDRRRAGGRLAECIPTPARITMDTFCRRMGLADAARADYEAFDTQTREVLEAYAAGVNACIATDTRLPVEFQMLGITAPPWEPWHCGVVLKMRHVMMGLFDSKLWRTRLMSALGSDGAVVPGSAKGREDLLIVPVGQREVFEPDLDALEPGALATSVLAEGSNNWAIHGSRTRSGAPLLAGDPHRTLEAPNVYYQNHIACPEFDAIGFSMPGVPGMFHFGHNADVAWCITHGMADTQDLYVERFRDDGTYEFKGEWRQASTRRETIRVRDGDDIDIDITTTHHGPVIFGDPSSGVAISFRWTATDRPDTTLRTVLRTLLATTVDELDEVMRDWVDPCNNMVMADRRGTIGYVHRGRIPSRSRANGWLPVPGWNGDHEWDADVPYEELPRLRNPEAGYIVTANNRVVGRDYPHYLSMDYGPPYRAMRTLERVSALERATAGDMASIHADDVSIPSRVFVEAIETLDDLSERAAQARDLLVDWDARMAPDSAPAAIYAATRDQVAALLIQREPLAAAVPNPFPEEPLPYSAHYRARSALPRLMRTPGAERLMGGSTWSDLVGAGLERAVEVLTERLGQGMSAWRWDAVHRTKTAHPLSVVFPEAADELNPPAVGFGGDGECVLAASEEVGLGIVHSAVCRYVFDLADWDNSRWIVPLGSSGHPASPHYTDQVDDWAACRLRPMTYSWPRVEAEAETRQLLEPDR